ncbi:MAG: OadG family transporter subunit [Pseudomonadales bacterium]|nr:OadG family transporter subunit [Pseudomonadales bacterium]
MQNQLIQQGIELMLYGMGTVLTFLVLLIIATTVMSALLQRFAKPEPTASAAPASKASSNDEHLIAVISAAIHKYRSRHKK